MMWQFVLSGFMDLKYLNVYWIGSFNKKTGPLKQCKAPSAVDGVTGPG